MADLIAVAKRPENVIRFLALWLTAAQRAGPGQVVATCRSYGKLRSLSTLECRVYREPRLRARPLASSHSGQVSKGRVEQHPLRCATWLLKRTSEASSDRRHRRTSCPCTRNIYERPRVTRSRTSERIHVKVVERTVLIKTPKHSYVEYGKSSVHTVGCSRCTPRARAPGEGAHTFHRYRTAVQAGRQVHRATQRSPGVHRCHKC